VPLACSNYVSLRALAIWLVAATPVSSCRHSLGYRTDADRFRPPAILAGRFHLLWDSARGSVATDDWRPRADRYGAPATSLFVACGVDVVMVDDAERHGELIAYL
jgi:hypothetical protein